MTLVAFRTGLPLTAPSCPVLHLPPGSRAPLALLLGLALSGCDGSTLGRVSVEEPLEPPIRVPGAPLSGALPLTLGVFALDVQSTEGYASEEADFVTEVRIRALELVIDPSSEDASTDQFENGMPDDFGFLSSIDLFIEAEFDGATQRARLGGLPQNDPAFDTGARTLSLQMTDVDILDYIEADDGYRVEISASGEAPPDDVVFGGTVTYRIGVGFD